LVRERLRDGWARAWMLPQNFLVVKQRFCLDFIIAVLREDILILISVSRGFITRASLTLFLHLILLSGLLRWLPECAQKTLCLHKFLQDC
jgi:hypothetical protein